MLYKGMGSCMATYHPSKKLSKLDKSDMQDTAGEVRTNPLVTYSSGSHQTDEQRQDDQLEPIFNSSVPIQDVALETNREQWMTETGGERESGRSMQAGRHDDDDDTDSFDIVTEVLQRNTLPQFLFIISINYLQ